MHKHQKNTRYRLQAKENPTIGENPNNPLLIESYQNKTSKTQRPRPPPSTMLALQNNSIIKSNMVKLHKIFSKSKFQHFISDVQFLPTILNPTNCTKTIVYSHMWEKQSKNMSFLLLPMIYLYSMFFTLSSFLSYAQIELSYVCLNEENASIYSYLGEWNMPQ